MSGAPKFTPGPWRADGEPWNRTVWSSADNRVCFMAHSNGLNDERDIATSYLIAAAPDMYAVLAAAPGDSAHITEWDAWREIASAALAKARGQA